MILKSGNSGGDTWMLYNRVLMVRVRSTPECVVRYLHLLAKFVIQLTAALGGLAIPPRLHPHFSVKNKAIVKGTHTLRGQEEKKKVYRPVSLHVFDKASTSNISPGRD
jgi:hypothetical protein